MKARLSDWTFAALFCAWVLSAVTGMGVMFGALPVIVDPEAVHLSGKDPTAPPPSRSAAVTGFVLGFLMVVWPLPFCRDDRSRRVDGFGRY